MKTRRSTRQSNQILVKTECCEAVISQADDEMILLEIIVTKLVEDLLKSVEKHKKSVIYLKSFAKKREALSELIFSKDLDSRQTKLKIDKIVSLVGSKL